MIYKVICFFLCSAFCCNIFAQSYSTEIGIQSDNDAYLAQKSDRYYTDGIFFYYRHALKVNPNLLNKIIGLEIGQKIFNPHTGSIFNQGIDNPIFIDRPFAAYLYIGSTLNFLYKNESNLKLGAQIGIVGPAAFGKQIQSFVHDKLGFYHPSGWEYQIDNDLELNLSAEYNRLLVRGSWIDASLTSYAKLGNGFSGGGVGPLFRLGDFNQLFNSLSTQSTVIKSNSVTPLHNFELFIYYKPQLNVVVWDATIEGSMFNPIDPNSMEVFFYPQHFVLSNQLGLAYSNKRFAFDIAAISHSKEVMAMVRPQQWGAVTFLYHFN